MNLDYFKDKVFDLLNDSEEMAISDIETNDREDRFEVFLQNGSLIEINFCESAVPVYRELRELDAG